MVLLDKLRLRQETRSSEADAGGENGSVSIGLLVIYSSDYNFYPIVSYSNVESVDDKRPPSRSFLVGFMPEGHLYENNYEPERGG